MARAAIVALGGVALVAASTAAVVAAMEAPRLDVPARVDRVFRDVTLVEPGRGPRRVAELSTRGGVIAHIRLADENANTIASGPVEAIDEPGLAGLYVAPGLSDLHVHYPPRIAVGNAELWSLLFIAHGVTSVRETGSIDGSIFDVREAIRAGRFPGPRVFACGEMLDGEQPSFPSNRVVASAEAGRDAVRRQVLSGADCIKVYNRLSPDALAAIRDEAARAGLPVIGHAPHSVPLEDAGVSDLQHGTGVVLIDPERVGRMDFRFADWTTVDDARIAHAAQVSRSQDIAHTPTLVNGRMRGLLSDPDGARRALEHDSGLRHLPIFWAETWRAIWGAPFARADPDGEALFERFRARQAAMTAQLHAAGVRIHAGTDTLMPFVAPGSSLHGELDALVAAGIPPEDVWAIATREAGAALGVRGLGTLEVGAPADLVFLRADPRRDLSALGEVEAVLADGRLYRRSDLDAMLEATDAHFHGALYSGVMNTLVRVVRNAFAPDDSGEREHS